MRRYALVRLVGLVGLVGPTVSALAGCSFSGASSSAMTCGEGLTLCNDTCVATETDPAHCGSCNAVCAGSCAASECLDACDLALESRVVDAWGTAWDGVERAALPLAEAEQTCAAIGGRLPRASELYRVRSNAPERLPGTTIAAQLWSSAAEDPALQVTTSLFDGAMASTAIGTPQPYRCVCADDDASFAGASCHGPPSEPCFAYGGRTIDAADRVALRRGAALGECASAGATLADPMTLVEASQAGLLGSGNLLQTADRGDYYRVTTIAWTDTTWSGTSQQLSLIDASLAAPFRCAARVGARIDPVADPTTFRLPDGTRVDGMDRAAEGWAAAHDRCIAAGGHLPRSAELAAAIRHGAPNGSGGFLWTADQAGYHPSVDDFLAGSLRWSAVDRRFSYRFQDDMPPDSITWIQKTANVAVAFRCIYYATDPAYPTPSCLDHCFDVLLGGNSNAHMWFDAVDREAATYEAAIAQCAQTRGELASERDLTEALRRGLPNGSSTHLWTSELAQGVVQTVAWANVYVGFSDQYKLGEMLWLAPGPTTTRKFRCRWTNELR